MTTPLPSPNPSETNRLKHEFVKEVRGFLLPNHSKGTALFKFLRHYTLKWHIRAIDPLEVLLEGIQRGLIFIETTGRPIQKPEAWLRSTCLNILRDLVKQRIKDEQLFQDSVVWVSHDHSKHSLNPLVQAELVEQIEILQTAFQQLAPADRDLIHLRFHHGYTYQQIQKRYESKDGRLISEAALRQRECRALKKLKEIFLKLYQTT